MKKFTTFFLTLIMALFFVSHTYSQTTTVLMPTKDNTLYEDPSGNLSNGVGMYFFAGRAGAGSGGGLERRGVVAFDVAGSIPAGSVITSAVLKLEKSKGGSGTNNVDVHRLLADWGEGTSMASAGEGAGAYATLNDATWLCTFSDGAAGCLGTWTGPGGDFSPTLSTNTVVAGSGTYPFPSTMQMVADVQDMLDDPANNFGWVLLGDVSAPGTAIRFNTKDNASPNTHPMLIVEYVACESSSVPSPIVDIEGDADVHGDLHVRDVLTLQPRACEPDVPVEGMIYYDLGLKKLRVYDGTTWQDCW